MTNVTHILSAIEQGDPQAAEQLLPLVYEELRKLAARKLAQEKPGQTRMAVPERLNL
jgi:DNA-binding GntR family transcriptional regulator